MSKSLNYEITGTNFKLSEANRGYVSRKIEKLIDYIPKKVRESARAEVRVEELDTKTPEKFGVNILLSLPGKELIAKEAGLDPQSAVDLAEVKIRAQLRKYKTENSVIRRIRKFAKRG